MPLAGIYYAVTFLYLAEHSLIDTLGKVGTTNVEMPQHVG